MILKSEWNVLIMCVFMLFSIKMLSNDISVININDSGSGSLRQAILDVNTEGSGPHTITFKPSLKGQTILLLSSLPQITVSDVTIDGDINADGVGDITIDAGTGENLILIFSFNEDASNTTIKGLTLQDTGLSPFEIKGSPIGINIENIVVKHNDGNFIDFGIHFVGNAEGLRVKNFTMTQGQEGSLGISITGVATDVIIDGFNYSNSGGVNNSGIKVKGDAYNVVIKNSVVDLDSPKSDDDGDYGIYFVATVDTITIDNVKIKDAEIYGIRYPNTTNSVIKNSSFSNFKGSGKAQMLRFDGTVDVLVIENNKIDMDVASSTDDGTYGLVFTKSSSNVKIINNTINAADEDGIYISQETSNMLIDGNTISNTGDGGGGDGIEFYNNVARSNIAIKNNTIDNGGIGRAGLIIKVTNQTSEFTITGNKISNNTKQGIWVTNGMNGSRNKVLITNNTIFNNTMAGVLLENGTDEILVSQNSMYNNGVGIDIVDSANCNYQKSAGKTVSLISSIAKSPTTFDVTFSLPSICSGRDCDVEFYVNKNGDPADNGRTYLQAFTNLPRGRQTINIKCEDDFCIKAPNGFWTATLTRVGSCGTSEFSNSLAINSQGPVCLSSDILLWLKSDNNPSYGTMTKGWFDFSGNGANFDEVFGDPELKKGNAASNYNPYIDFDGKDYFRPLAGAINSRLTAGEIISVGRVNSTNAKRGPMHYFGGNSDGSHYTWDDGVVYETFGTTDRLGVNPKSGNVVDNKIGLSWNNSDVDVTNWTVYGVHSKSKDWGMSFNGNLQSSKVNTANFTQIGKKEYVGAFPGAIFKGEISEIIMYSRVLSVDERHKINSYLALKYGITLDQSKPTNYVASDSITTMWKASDNLGYDHNIAGLGKDLGATCDNTSNLHQTIANSTNKDSMVTIAVGNEVDVDTVDNLTNQTVNPIKKDLSFFTWGSNSEPTSFDIEISAKSANVRMARVWRVDKTKFEDQELTIKLLGASTNTYLLISNKDASFETIDQELQMNTKGSTSINSKKISDGAFFTFGSKVSGPVCIADGVSVWLRADGGNVNPDNWTDYSGNGNNFVQTTPSLQPKVKSRAFNFNPALDFESDRFDLVTSKINATQNTIIVVNKPDVVSGVRSLVQFGKLKESNVLEFRHNNSATQYIEKIAADSSSVKYDGLISSESYIDGVSQDNTANTGVKIYRNSTTANATGGVSYSPNNNPIYVGGEHGFDGLISEVIVFNRIVTSLELKKIYSYLALKYGITLNQSTTTDYIAIDGTTTMWEAASNIGYANNIAGLGKDLGSNCLNTSQLHQTVSKSANKDALITMAVGSGIDIKTVDNPSNQSKNPITNDNSFLTWGNNGKSTSFDQPLKNSTSTVRMARVWKVDKTNFADQMLTINLLGGNTNNNLLLSSDPLFETIDQELELDSKGNVNVDSLNIPDGVYFTFGSSYKGPACVNLGIKLWLKADQGGLDWKDQSGNNCTITKTGKPVNGTPINFNPSNALLLTDYYSASTDIKLTDDLMVFAVFRGGKEYLGGLNSTETDSIKKSNMWIRVQNTYSVFSNAISENQSITHPDSLSVTNPYITSVFSSSGTPKTEIGVNGKIEMGTLTITPGDRVGIGTDLLNNLGSGLVSEFIVYSRNATNVEKNKIHAYLALKYGITLDQSTPMSYLSSDGTTVMWDSTLAEAATYNNDIFGIGRDDCTELGQLKSRSANGDGIITVLAEGESSVNSNDAPKYTFTDIEDKEFLMIGNNNEKAEWTATDSPSNFQVLARRWSVQETGEVGTLQLDFDMENVEFDVPKTLSGTEYFIVIDTNNDGNLTDESPKALTNIGKDKWSIKGVNLNTGMRFTIATAVSL